MTVRTHPRNTSFAWRPASRPGAELAILTAEQARQWDDDGFVLLEGVFGADEIAAVEAAIDPAEAELEAFLREHGEDGRIFIARADEITFTTHLVARSPELAAFTRHPVFTSLVHDVIGPDVRLYWDQAVYKKPRTEAPFPWHQDNGYTFVEPQQYLTCWVPLTPATLETGCPWVVPGLHRLGTLAHELTDLGFVCLDDAPSAVPVEAAVGDVVVFSSLTPHCTGPNRSERTRKAYIVQYAPDGAEILREGKDGAVTRVRADDPARQYPVLGCAVAPG